MMSSEHLPDNVCESTVKQGLCVGCGVCAGLCPTDNLAMHWNEFGEYNPVDMGRCQSGCNMCLQVCPFQDHEKNEDTLAESRFGHVHGIKHRPEVGYYLNCYVGFASVGDYRSKGASGGLASWFLAGLIERGIVDAVACVAPNADPDALFKFAVFESADEVRNSSKSCYYPVELSEVIRHITNNDKRYALIALPCFLKSLNYARLIDRRLEQRLTVLAGLICGHSVSRYFADYLIRSVRLAASQVQQVSFREKSGAKSASDYHFSAADEQLEKDTPWSGKYGEAWSTGQFKLNSCNYCDDIFAETADIVFGDAWIPPYMSDWHGTSIVITRSEQADELIMDGIRTKQLRMESLDVSKVIASQASITRDRRVGLAHRLYLADAEHKSRPQKRVTPVRPSILTRALLRASERLRLASREGMVAQQKSPTGIDTYEAVVRPATHRLQSVEKVRLTINKLRGVVGLMIRKLGLR